MSKCIILLGGPSKGTRFRPLSLDVPKPLFPLAGVPLLTHHLDASRKIPELKEILLIGFFPNDSLRDFLSKMQQTFNHVPIRYLNEGVHAGGIGTAGGLYKFRKEILEGDPAHIFVLHHDILCSFPLAELLSFHKRHGKSISILGKQINAAEARHFGCLVEDPGTHQVLHFAEKPETFVSDMANCGVYVFSPSVFKRMEEVAALLNAKEADIFESSPRTSSGELILSLEKDVLIPLAGKNEMFLFQTSDFFIQIKLAGEITRCQEVVLREYRKKSPQLLAKSGEGKTGPTVIGEVLIDPTATVHPSAKLGPNVSIGANVKVAAGARIKHSIILDNTEIREHACVLYSVIGWESRVGPWARIEGTLAPHTHHDKANCGITIFGRDVSAAPEIIVRSSVVLPHKSLSESYTNEILL